jgi:hypothetical protein
MITQSLRFLNEPNGAQRFHAKAQRKTEGAKLFLGRLDF